MDTQERIPPELVELFRRISGRTRLHSALSALGPPSTGFAVGLHLGDNPDAFPGTPYVGLTLTLPVRITIISPPGNLLIIRTSLIETHADWQKHTVRLDGNVLGYLSDNTGTQDEVAIFSLTPQVVEQGQPQRLTIEVGATNPGLLDDFIIRDIYAFRGVITVGWA